MKSAAQIDLSHIIHIPRLRRTTFVLTLTTVALIVVIAALVTALIYSYRFARIRLLEEINFNSNTNVEMKYVMSSIDYHTERQKLIKFITMKIRDETQRASKYNKSVRKITTDEAYAIANAIAKYTEIYPSIDPIFALAIARRESFFNRKAKSNKGAMGIWQLMPSTAMSLASCLGTQVNDSLLQDIDFNARYGIALLDILLLCYRVPEKVLVAWNAGPKWVYSETVPEETALFIPSVLEYYRTFSEEYRVFDAREMSDSTQRRFVSTDSIN